MLLSIAEKSKSSKILKTRNTTNYLNFAKSQLCPQKYKVKTAIIQRFE